MPEILVDDPTPAVIAAAQALLAQVFVKAEHLDRAYLTWDYAENPDGPALLVNAYEEQEVVAHWAGQTLRARIAGREVRGVLVHHLCTHPSQQSKGLFTALGERAAQAARERDLQFIVAVANANSTPGFVRRLGFQHVGSLDVKIGLGRPPVSSGDQVIGFERLWGAESLAWRLACPAKRYRRVGGASGAGVVGGTGLPGIRAWLGSVNGAAVEALPTVRRLAPTLWLGREPAIDWTRSGFVDVPARARPSPLNLVYLDLHAESTNLEPETLRFRGLDFDAY